MKRYFLFILVLLLLAAYGEEPTLTSDALVSMICPMSAAYLPGQ